MGSYGSLWIEPYGFPWRLMNFLWTRMETYGILDSYDFLWVPMDSYRFPWAVLWNPMESYGVLCTPMDSDVYRDFFHVYVENHLVRRATESKRMPVSSTRAPGTHRSTYIHIYVEAAWKATRLPLTRSRMTTLPSLRPRSWPPRR